jgi:hypothetical protein
MTHPQTPDSQTPDIWDGWSPRPERNGKSPHALQERHSPTTGVSLRGATGKQQAACLRRVADARLWDAMSQAQQDAAREIALACEVLGQGLGYAASNWERIPGARANNALECREKMVGFYVQWTARCREERISHSLIADILVYGFSCRALDRDQRVRAGTAKRNLLRGLSLYCKMKGWRA